jgi:hypothetical protein
MQEKSDNRIVHLTDHEVKKDILMSIWRVWTEEPEKAKELGFEQ